MCLILKTFMCVLNFHQPCDIPGVKDITHLPKQRAVNWDSVRKYPMEKVLLSSLSFIKLQNVTNCAWFLGGRSCSFPSYSCATLFLELCPIRGKSSRKAPGTHWPCPTFSMSTPTGCEEGGTKPERRIQGWNSSHPMLWIKNLNV